MKSTFLVAIVLVFSAVMGFPLEKHAKKTPRSYVSKPKIFNAPLLDWVKDETTDLQWYTTIFVGTPPQEL